MKSSKDDKNPHTQILNTDPKTKETFIKLPITDLSELGFMQQSLLENLHLLSQLEDQKEVEKPLKDIVFWLSKILLASYPENELKELSKLVKSASKLL